MSSSTPEEKIEGLKRKIIKSDRRIDEISKRVRLLERQMMRRIETKDPKKNKCTYCGIPIIRGDLCGRCKAILGEDS